MTGYTDGEAAFGVTATWNALQDGTSCEENNGVTCWDGSCDYDEMVYVLKSLLLIVTHA